MGRRPFALFAAVLVTAGCGTASSDPPAGNKSAHGEEWPILETADGRDIIAKLEQKGTEPSKRQQAVKDNLAYTDFQEGYFGEQTEEAERDMEIQIVEGPAAIEAVEAVYGMEGFDRQGILFYELEADGASLPGVWIGVKKPDDRLQQVLDRLQRKVDAGELLAELIHFYRSPHTQQDLIALQDQVSAAVKKLYEGSGSYAVSVDTISGDISVTHDFLKRTDIDALKKQFQEKPILFQQEGSMAPEPGQSAVILPDHPETETPQEEGGFVLDTGDGGFLVAGGTEAAVSYAFAEADRLTAGSRVTVDATGPFAESYPAQGQAKYVTVHPDYRPAGAALSESQVIRMAIEATDEPFLVVETVTYDTEKKTWTVKEAEGNELVFQDR